ncbi:MAG: CPBP family intramembrane glutamic endopeptidase [Chthoniobacterales bacterium]
MFIGVLVAPWIYQAIQRVPPCHVVALSKFIASLQTMPFHRYVSRSVQVTAFVLLWPMIRWLGIAHLSELKLYKNTRALADLLYGVVAALLPLWLLETVLVWKGWYLFNFTVTTALLLKLLSTAAVVAVLEEFFFRGVLLGLSRRFLSARGAVVFSALLFAGVHFLSMPRAPMVTVHWWSGLALCAAVGQGVPELPLFLGAFSSLLVLGMILAWVTVRTASLWLAIGLHGAWIFGQQAFNHVAHYAITPPNALLPWIGMPQVYGMVPVGLLFFLPLAGTFVCLRPCLKERGYPFTGMSRVEVKNTNGRDAVG